MIINFVKLQYSSSAFMGIQWMWLHRAPHSLGKGKRKRGKQEESERERVESELFISGCFILFLKCLSV